MDRGGRRSKNRPRRRSGSAAGLTRLELEALDRAAMTASTAWNEDHPLYTALVPAREKIQRMLAPPGAELAPLARESLGLPPAPARRRPGAPSAPQTSPSATRRRSG